VDSVLGHSLPSLPLPLRLSLVGQWVAFEVYTPKTLPLQRIAAAGPNVASCRQQLLALGLDPLQFEFQLVGSPFAPAPEMRQAENQAILES
jgi:hypothetical protein